MPRVAGPQELRISKGGCKWVSGKGSPGVDPRQLAHFMTATPANFIIS